MTNPASAADSAAGTAAARGEVKSVADGRRETVLPSTSVSTHASFLLRLANGDLGCVWFGGTQEGKPDVSIYFSRLPVGSATWEPEQKVSDDPTRSEQNPVLFETPKGDLWLLYTAQIFGDQDTSIVRRRISRDGGRSWSPIETFIDVPGTFIRNPIIVAANGDWLLPIFRCRQVAGAKWNGSDDFSAVRISSDEGLTWTEHEVPQSIGAVHMNIVRLDDRLVAFYRDRRAGFVLRSVSTDNGRNWSAPTPTSVPNNNASIQARRLEDGRIVLICNPINARMAGEHNMPDLLDRLGGKVVWGTPRAPVSLFFSADGGESFAGRIDIETGPGWCHADLPTLPQQGNSELSYPSVEEKADGTLAMSFTYHRKQIKYVELTP
jgi:predicted neuraminidase